MGGVGVKAIPVTIAKQKVLAAISAGMHVNDAMKSVGRTAKTYENWRCNDDHFRADVDRIRGEAASARKRGIGDRDRTLSFAEWRKEFLDQETYPHQQAWIDIIEKGDYSPREGEHFELNDPNRIIINVPPFHAKSQTLTVEYVTYRICMDINTRVIIVSKRQDQAKKFLYSIKQRLTSTQWALLQNVYAPNGGFRMSRQDGGTWGMDRFYVSGIDSGEKDPTVEGLGIGGQIYGSRADLIILDDCVVNSNAHQFEQQINWLESEVENRAFDGKIIIIGTRLTPQDLYSELCNGDRYLSGRSPWTVLRQPAVLQFAEDPEDWVTLWPETTKPMETGQKKLTNGNYEAWPGKRMNKVRNSKPPRVWALVYQQMDTVEDAIFHPTCVLGSVERRRKPGPLRAGAWGHPRNGMEGHWVIASMDPAMAGDTFTLVGAIEKTTLKRRIMNAWVQTGPTPQYIRDLIKTVSDEYAVNEWVIEQNAFQLFLIYDEDIQEFCRMRGIKITPHFTSRNKLDPDFGVASLAPLFGNLKRHVDGGRPDHDGNNLMELPDLDMSPAIKLLVEELTTWQPGFKGRELKQDGPMALWFFELRAREILGIGQRRQQHFVENPYLTRGDRNNRVVIPTNTLYRETAWP